MDRSRALRLRRAERDPTRAIAAPAPRSAGGEQSTRRETPSERPGSSPEGRGRGPSLRARRHERWPANVEELEERVRREAEHDRDDGKRERDRLARAPRRDFQRDRVARERWRENSVDVARRKEPADEQNESPNPLAG